MNLPDNLFLNGFSPSGEPIDIGQLRPCREFIREHFAKGKEINGSRTSYWLKDIVAKRIKKPVKDGELIASMILEGFVYQIKGSSALFDVTEASIRVLFSEKVLSLAYKVIKLLFTNYAIQLDGTKSLNKILKEYNNHEMPIKARIEKLLLDQNEISRFAEYIKGNNIGNTR